MNPIPFGRQMAALQSKTLEMTTKQQIESAKISAIACVTGIFDALLLSFEESGKVARDDDFLAEMNSTNDAEPQAKYGGTMIVEAPPSIPDLEGIKPLSGIENHIEEVIERFDLETTDVKTLIPLDRWKKLCSLVITGWQGKEVAKVTIDNNLIKEGFALTVDQEKHLEQLRGVRRAMLAKDMDLQTAKGQNGVEVWEWVALETLAKENNLK